MPCHLKSMKIVHKKVSQKNCFPFTPPLGFYFFFFFPCCFCFAGHRNCVVVVDAIDPLLCTLLLIAFTVFVSFVDWMDFLFFWLEAGVGENWVVVGNWLMPLWHCALGTDTYHYARKPLFSQVPALSHLQFTLRRKTSEKFVYSTSMSILFLFYDVVCSPRLFEVAV